VLTARVAVTSTVLLAGLLSTSSVAFAAEAPVGLGTVGAYSVLGGQTVTNTGPTTMSRNLGVSPGSAITGFPPGTTGGATHAGDAPAAQAQSDLVTAYNDAAGRAPTAGVGADLVGQTLTAGVYNASGPLGLSGALTLDGQGDPNAVFIFQASSTLITASSSSVNVINGAQACNIYWQVGSSATLGTASTFRGTIMAMTSITVTTNTVVEGRALARTGSVTLDNNTFTTPDCSATTPAAATTAAATPTTTASRAPTTRATRGTRATASAGPTRRAAENRSRGTAAATSSASSLNGGSDSDTPGGLTQLAHTGSSLTPLYGAGTLLLVVGGLLVAAGRRPVVRTHRHRRH
jgi:hypothetical protein